MHITNVPLFNKPIDIVD